MIDDGNVALGSVARPPSVEKRRASTRGRRDGRTIFVRRRKFGTMILKGRGLMFMG